MTILKKQLIEKLTLIPQSDVTTTDTLHGFIIGENIDVIKESIPELIIHEAFPYNYVEIPHEDDEPTIGYFHELLIIENKDEKVELTTDDIMFLDPDDVMPL